MNEKQENGGTDATSIIDELLKEVGLNAPTFAKTIGVNYQRIFDLQRGRVKKFNPEIVRLTCDKYPYINPNYLFTGVGSLKLTPGGELRNGDIADMVDRSVEKILERSEYKRRMETIDDREQMLSKKEQVISEREGKITGIMSDIMAKDRYLIKKEEELSSIEKSLMKRELEIALREKELGISSDTYKEERVKK
jgi:hypothetical protein